MKYEIVGKNIVVTKGISDAIMKKLSKMDKYFEDTDAMTCRAVVRSYKTGAKVEITIVTKHMTFRSEVTDPDLYAAVDLSIDKLEGQMRKLKTRLQRGRNGRESLGKSIVYEALEPATEEIDDQVVRTKSYMLQPITMDEAITRMEGLGHSFYIYLDEEDEKVSVIYKRNEGGYGLIQAENKVEIE